VTLILNHASDLWVLQVSDRMVSRAGVPFDPVANKALVVILPDSVLSIAYTGLSYLDNLPTDCWLAQEVLGRQLEVTHDGRAPMVEFGPQARLAPRLDLLVSRLLAALPGAIGREPNRGWRRLAPTIVLAGYRWSARRPRRTILGALEPAANRRYTYGSATRPAAGQFVVNALPRTNVSQDTWDRLKPRARSTNVAAVRLAMIEAVRATSASLPGVVGPETTGIWIDGSEPSIEVTFDSPAPATGELVSGTERIPLSIAYTPWVIAPGLVYSPTAHAGAGCWDIRAAGWSIRVNGTEPPPGPLESAASSQPRPPRPA
jgi:hypothetical protein